MVFYLQYISDIHLEFRKDEKIEIMPVNENVKNIALCGDIGNPREENYFEFINHCSKNFENVFVIYGNHEFYSLKSIIETMSVKKKYARYFPKNVYFMDDSCLYANKITNKVYDKLNNNEDYNNYIKIIGSTLWTKINYETSRIMNDCKCIYVDTQYDDIVFNLSSHNIKTFFKKSVEYIIGELDKEKEIKTVLLTHHGTHPIFLNNRTKYVSSGYVTYIKELYSRKNLIVSIAGHTHNSIEEEIEFDGHSIKFLSNAYGYPRETNTKYNKDAYLEIK